MVRKAEFEDNDFLVAATKLIAEGGPAAASIKAISGITGAPVGSIYHRFASRDVILAQSWLAAQEAVLEVTQPHMADGKGELVVHFLMSWAEENPEMAGLITGYRQTDLMGNDAPKDLVKQANDIPGTTDKMIGKLLSSTGKRNTKVNRALMKYALLDGPYAVMKGVLETGVPSWDKSRELALMCYYSTLELLE